MIRVCIVCESPLYLTGLQTVLSSGPDLAVVGVAPEITEAIGYIRHLRPDVILLDCGSAVTVEKLHAVRTASPESRLILLMVSETESEIIVGAGAGVSGYIARDASIEDVKSAIYAAMKGELKCSPRVAALLHRRVAAVFCDTAHMPVSEGADFSEDRLTFQEHRILIQLELGRTNKEISAALGIEVATVKNHVHKVLSKLGVSTRGEAAAFYRRRFLWRQPVI